MLPASLLPCLVRPADPMAQVRTHLGYPADLMVRILAKAATESPIHGGISIRILLP